MLKRLSCMSAYMAAAILVVSSSAMGEVTTNVKIPIVDFTTECEDGNVLEVSGSLHILITATTSASGNTKLTTHFQPQGAKAVVVEGPDFGAKYTGTGVTRETMTFSGDNYQSTFINRFDFHGQGRAPNYKTRTTMHITFANGEVRVDFEKIEVQCN